MKVFAMAAESEHKFLSVKRLQYIIHFLLLSMTMPRREAVRILSFDTSTPRGSIAILEGGRILGELRLHSPKTHSVLLMKSVDFLLDRLGWELRDIELIAAGIGPGSFTGIRIGIATALGIAQSLSIPFAGISGLDALASQVAGLSGHIGVLLDAHRLQVYYAEYLSDGRKTRQYKKPALLHISDLELRLANRHLYIAGDLELLRSRQNGGSPQRWPRSVSVDPFLASSIGRLASVRRRLWRSGEYIVAQPLYIRPPDALRNKRRKR
jgi:tRNA threonylcarbamoyladenosine biosynthesis protein TsaB